MKLLIKRIIIGFIVVVVSMIIFCIAVNHFKEREYKYMTLDNEWGISNKCYLDDEQFAICKLDDDWVIVRQFYEA